MINKIIRFSFLGVLSIGIMSSCKEQPQQTDIKPESEKTSAQSAQLNEEDFKLDKEIEMVKGRYIPDKDSAKHLLKTEENIKEPAQEKLASKPAAKKPSPKPVETQAVKTLATNAAPVAKKAAETQTAIKKEIPKAKPAKSLRKAGIAFQQKSFDFGQIEEGEEVDFKFVFKNTGNKDLEILDAKVTCGCTHPSYPFLAIPPGETAYIGVSYKSVGKFGKQNPKVTITTNTTPKTIDLYLNGFVNKKKEVVKEIAPATNPIETMETKISEGKESLDDTEAKLNIDEKASEKKKGLLKGKSKNNKESKSEN